MKSSGVESVHDERWRLREMLRLARSVRSRDPRRFRWLVPVLKQAGPTLLYAGCLTAYVLDAVGFWTLVFAWGYVAGRLIQSAVHMTSNNPSHRGLGFVFGAFCMLALWINLALSIVALQ